MFTFAPAFQLINELGEIRSLFGSTADPLPDDRDGRTIKRLVDILESSGLKAALLEQDYTDADHKAGFSRYYYLHYRDTARRCKRVHFFSTELTEHDIYEMPLEVRDAYLGYTVIRPFSSHTAGRTILSEKVLNRMYPGLFPEERRVATCSANYVVHIAGTQIKLHGVPWMQQDGLIAVCASTAIWMANWHMSHLYPEDFRRFTTSQITDLAVRYSLANGRAMPSDGLSVEQMLSSLNAMGYEPLYIGT